LKVHISEGSVATQLRCGGIFNNQFITNFLQNVLVKKNLKIGQYLAKMWTKVCGLFFGTPCRHRFQIPNMVIPNEDPNYI